MPLFGHKHDAAAATQQPHDTVQGLAGYAASQGWRGLGDQPFDGHVETLAHEVTLAMYGVSGNSPDPNSSIKIGPTLFHDSFGGSADGRNFGLTTGWTSAGKSCPVAVCAAELPTILPLSCVQPRHIRAAFPGQAIGTGDPAFDGQFLVQAFDPDGAQTVLTPRVRQLLMARNDWFLLAERYFLVLVRKGTFDSADAARQQLNTLYAIIAAIPESVLPPGMNTAADALTASLMDAGSGQEAQARLQSLSQDQRDAIAQSGSPMAALLGASSQEEALARLQGLDPRQKAELIAQFMRLKDQRRR